MVIQTNHNGRIIWYNALKAFGGKIIEINGHYKGDLTINLAITGMIVGVIRAVSGSTPWCGCDWKLPKHTGTEWEWIRTNDRLIDDRSGSGTKCFVKHDHKLVAHSG